MAEAVMKKLEAKKIRNAAKKMKESIHETLAYYDFPGAHWRRIRPNNPLGLQPGRCSESWKILGLQMDRLSSIRQVRL